MSHALAVIERPGYESGAYDTFIRTDSNIIAKQPLKTDGTPASGGPSLRNVDAIFFMGHRDVPIDDTQKFELLSFVRDEASTFSDGFHQPKAYSRDRIQVVDGVDRRRAGAAPMRGPAATASSSERRAAPRTRDGYRSHRFLDSCTNTLVYCIT
ncbi:MAG: hypothetical protein ABI818_06855 [Acidobacteriota bacterium]